MSTGNKVFGIIAFLMILFVYLNEMKNITEFIIKYKSIKDIARINMEQKCKNIYCEAETDRFQIAKNMYDLLLPNDIYNAKTYTVMVMIFSIMLFIYVFYTYICYINGLNDFEITWSTWVKTHQKPIVIGMITIAIFIMILVNIILRYTPYDEKGYINYFVKDSTGSRRPTDFLNYTIFSLLGGLLIIYIVLKMFLVPKLEGYERLRVLFNTLYFIFAFYFMYNMINIVEAFRTNNVPKDIYSTDENKGEGSNWQKYWSADIGYDSENYFYNTFFDIKEIPFAIFSNFTDDKQKYDINDIYIFRNLPIIGFALFIFIMILLVIYIFTGDADVKKYILQFLPVVFLFFLVFAIVVFTTFNTAFNKYVLYGVCKSSYTRALNGLNNAVVPFIAMHEKDSGGVNNNLTDYRYNYIVLSVIISYFTNHVNLMTNKSNVTITAKTDKEDAKYVLSENIGKETNKFKDETSIKNNFKKLKPISDSDTTDLGKFEAYYKECFKEILGYENIPSNLSVYDIQSLYIELLNKIFYNAKEKPNTPATPATPTISEESFQTTKDSKVSNNSDLINRIRNSVYYYIKKLENFNDNVSKYNDAAHSDRTTFMQDSLFYVNDDNTIDPYKFIMIKNIMTTDVSEYSGDYDKIYKTHVDNVINAFLTHIRSLYKDVHDATSGYSIKTTEDDKSSVFNSQIKTSLTMLSDTKGTESKTITRETTEDKLEYLFKSLKDFKIKVNANTNYLVNVIETISNQLNHTDAKVQLYDVTTNTTPNTLEIKASSPQKLSEISNILPTKVAKDEEINAIDILHSANKTVQETFTLAYATNIFVLGIVYLLISKL
jgi:hypothetical protein